MFEVIAEVEKPDFSFAVVKENKSTGEKALFSVRQFRAGEVISSFGATAFRSKPSYLTLQTGPRMHIMLYPTLLQYTNHSCRPNVFFDTQRMKLVCVRDIAGGDELCYFYPSTEWEMAQPFECRCGTPDCLGIIRGAVFLTVSQLQQYPVNEHIRKMHHARRTV